MVKSYYFFTKHFQGGMSNFYVELNPSNFYMTKFLDKLDEDILEIIGDNTEGGHAYGYRLTYDKVDKKDIPKGAKILRFKRVVRKDWVIDEWR